MPRQIHDCDKFKGVYLNKITVDKARVIDMQGSKTGFEEDGILMICDDPMVKLKKPREVFISAEIIQYLYHILQEAPKGED
jgi:hypothetical protein